MLLYKLYFNGNNIYIASRYLYTKKLPLPVKKLTKDSSRSSCNVYSNTNKLMS